MPLFDGSGPQGLGPVTGRRGGYCGRGINFRLGRRCNRGLARYFGWNSYENKVDQIKDYESYKQALKEELEDIDEALTSLKKID